MRVAVIGCGVIGKLHAQTVRALAPRMELAVVVDVDEARATELAAECETEAATDFEAVLDREDIDAVTICTPSGQHADVAVAALGKGKHVMIEKPIDITLDAARRIVDAAGASTATAMVVSQKRHERASLIVREAVSSGMFGRITSGTAHMAWWRSQAYYDSGDWRGTWALDGGGALMNQGIHAIDLLVWFMGEPVEVFAWTDCLAHERIEVEDVAVATVRFASGAIATINGTTAAYPGLNARVGVYGDRGSGVLDDGNLVYFHAAEDDAPAYDYGAGGRANQAEVVLETVSADRPAGSVGGSGGADRADDSAGADRAAGAVGAAGGDGAAGVDGTADPDSGDGGSGDSGGQEIAGLAPTSHTTQFEDFVDAVEKGRPPLVTVEEATRTLAVIRGIYESAKSGSVVRLKEV